MERDVAVIHRDFERVLRPGERADVKWHLSSLGGGGSRRGGVGGGARHGGGGGGGGRVGAVTTRGGDGVEVVVDAVEVVVDGRHHPAAEVVVLVHARRGVGIGGGVRRAVHAEPLQERRDARARRLDARDKLGKVVAVEVLCGSEGRRGGRMGQSRPRETRRRRRLRAGGAEGKSGKGGGEVHTSFQGKIRAFSIADRLGKRRKRLEQRFRLLALGTRHLADSAAPRGVPSGTGSRFAGDEEVPKRARESDRPIASRLNSFGSSETRGPKRATAAAQRGARRHGLVHRRPRTEAGTRGALPARGARNV